MTSAVGNIILGAAQRHGVDPNALSTIAHLESRGNPAAQNPKSSAGGLFQFIDSTANAYGLRDRFDPAQASDAAARLTRDNSAALSKSLGRQPSIGELYLAHQQGAGGASRLLSNPDRLAVDVVGADAVRLNGGRPDMTAQEFANIWINKANAVASPATAGTATRNATAPEPLLGGQDMGRQPTQRRGLLGGLLSEDARDRLILGLEGMTLNPNKGLQQAAAQGLQQRGQQRATQQQANRTAEWLKAQGRDDLAQAVAGGSIDPKTAVQTALTPAKDTRTASQKDFEFAVERGFTGTFEDFKRAGAQQINLPGNMQVVGDQVLVPDPTNPAGVRFVPIPGGETEREAQEIADKTLKTLELGEQKASIVDDQIDAALGLMEKKSALDIIPETGIIGGTLGALGLNQEAVDLKNTLLGIKGMVAFDTLQKMREASKTGGALGGVSEVEITMLSSALGTLEQTTSKELLAKNLNTIKTIMGKIANDPVASKFLPPAPTEDAQAGAGSAGGFSVTGRID